MCSFFVHCDNLKINFGRQLCFFSYVCHYPKLVSFRNHIQIKLPTCMFNYRLVWLYSNQQKKIALKSDSIFNPMAVSFHLSVTKHLNLCMNIL